MRIAAVLLTWDKATLVERLPEILALSDEDGGLDPLKDFLESQKFFEGLAHVCEAAQLRVLVAGSFIEVNGGWPEERA